MRSMKQHEEETPTTEHDVPTWLRHYLNWAGTTGNQTPLIFHQAAGLWLLSTAIGKRLYGEAPWGVRLYPNLYLMLVADTTFYRKPTAYKLTSLFVALVWMDTTDTAPTVNDVHWRTGQAIAEEWRQSAHRLLEQLDRSGEAIQEKRHQDRMLRAVRATGSTGIALRVLYHKLKGVYGRLHVMAFKLASLFAALDWLDTSKAVPTVTNEHWQSGQAIAEEWRQSAHRLLEQLDRSGEAIQEKRHQDRMLRAVRATGTTGIALRVLYRNLNFSAKHARQIAQDLVRAGLIEERRLNKAEWFIASEYVNESAT